MNESPILVRKRLKSSKKRLPTFESFVVTSGYANSLTIEGNSQSSNINKIKLKINKMHSLSREKENVRLISKPKERVSTESTPAAARLFSASKKYKINHLRKKSEADEPFFLKTGIKFKKGNNKDLFPLNTILATKSRQPAEGEQNYNVLSTLYGNENFKKEKTKEVKLPTIDKSIKDKIVKNLKANNKLAVRY